MFFLPGTQLGMAIEFINPIIIQENKNDKN